MNAAETLAWEMKKLRRKAAEFRAANGLSATDGYVLFYFEEAFAWSREPLAANYRPAVFAVSDDRIMKAKGGDANGAKTWEDVPW